MNDHHADRESYWDRVIARARAEWPVEWRNGVGVPSIRVELTKRAAELLKAEGVSVPE